jgi:hypothetical protein
VNRLISISVLCFILTNIFAQKLLLVENVNSLKNYKYYQGQDIIIKFAGSEGRIADHIFDLTDTTVILEIMGEVRLENVSCIYRENWFVQTLRGLGLLGGAAYFGIDSFNRMINHEYPVVDTGTLLISGGMVAFSFALTPLRYKRINTGEKWHLRTINLNSF